MPQPSQTAMGVARRRAAHQVLDDPPVFVDPLALDMAGLTPEQIRAADQTDAVASVLTRAVRAFLAVRSRVAEDEVTAAAARGLRQYVVLGAGFDTFAYRSPLPDLRVFEVDQPATQAAKLQRLAESAIAVPPSTTFVPVDFTVDSLAEELDRARFDPAAGAIFSWLGVTPYLDRDAVLHTLRTVGGIAGRGGSLVFDYGIPPHNLDPVRRAAFETLLLRLEAAGEPWLTFFEPADLARQLADCGFGEVVDLGGDELNAGYFADRTDGLRVGSIGRVVIART